MMPVLGMREYFAVRKEIADDNNFAAALDNDPIASRLEEVAELLADQGANPFRVGAFRKAAQTLHDLRRPVVEILKEEGPAGLVRLPGIGRSIANAIAQFQQSGKIPLLERLRGEHAPERIFTTVAEIGPKLATRIHEELGLDSLGELEAAAWDGRLARVSGMGAKRVQAIREALAGRHAQADKRSRREEFSASEEQPPVAELLEVDRKYRRLIEQDRLPKIAPRRFNPSRTAWLPIMHLQREERHYTAMFSNTARAHEFGKTHDWVVIYRDDGADHGQWTVITSSFGKLHGKRIVRGREPECADYYAATDSPLP
jgi:Holliday junction resolvasome RuvABC DNA-binding subunit